MLPTQRGADSTPGGGLRSHMPCIMAKIKKKKQLNYLEKHHGLGSNDRSQQVWTSSASPPGDHHSWPTLWSLAGFPGSLAGKESACNAGDSGSIPELGRCPGDRIGYPLQYSWASLVAGGLDGKESESRSVISNSLRLHGLYSPWNSPGQNSGVGSCSLLQGIFPTQGSNPGLLHCRQILYQLNHQGSPRFYPWVGKIPWRKA